MSKLTKNAVRKKIRALKSLFDEWEMLDTLISSLEKNKEKGLETPEAYLTNVKRKRDAIQKELTTKLK